MEYADFTLEELLEVQRELTETYEAARAEYKRQLALLKPYLDTAWADYVAAEAAKADPSLDQGIG